MTRLQFRTHSKEQHAPLTRLNLLICLLYVSQNRENALVYIRRIQNKTFSYLRVTEKGDNF